MCQCCPQIESNQLICRANQLTGFYMMAKPALNGLNKVLARKEESNTKVHLINPF